MRGKNHTSIPSPFTHHSIKEHPLSQSDSIIFHHILSTLFPRTPRRKKKKKSLDTSTKFRNSIPPLPSTFPAKERNLHTGEILNSEPNLTFSFSGRGKKKGEKWRGEKKRAEDRNDPSRDVNSTSTRYEVKQPARAVFPRKGRSFCRVSCAPIKKRMAENRGSHVIFGRYSSFERNFLPAFPPKSKGGIRRETAENCCNAVFYWAAERWFRSTKRRNHEQRSAMHNGIQGMQTEGVPFFRMSMQIRLFTDDDGEK